MNIKLLLSIIAVAAVLGLLSIVPVRAFNAKVIAAEDKRKNGNAFEAIINMTRNTHPVFNESLKGKIIVLNVWGTWSGMCKGQIPELNKLVKDFGSDKVVFLALDASDSLVEGSEISRQNIQFNYRQLFGQQILIHALSSFELPNEIGMLPINAVIGPEGKFEVYYTGARVGQVEAIRAYLEKAVGGK